MGTYKISLIKTAVRKGVKTTFSQLYYSLKDIISRRQRVYKIDANEPCLIPDTDINGYSKHIYDSWNEIPAEYRKVFEEKNNGMWWNTEQWLSNDMRLWLGTVTNEPAIFAYTCQGTDVKSFYFRMPKNCLFIRYIYTLPQYRGRGLMPFLLSHILCRSFNDGFESACVIVDEYNAASISCIEKVGFRHIGNGIAQKHSNRHLWFPNLAALQPRKNAESILCNRYAIGSTSI